MLHASGETHPLYGRDQYQSAKQGSSMDHPQVDIWVGTQIDKRDAPRCLSDLR